MSEIRGKWADEYWVALKNLPGDCKRHFSIHDFRMIAAPLLDQIEAQEKTYLSAVGGRADFRAAFRKERARIAEVEASNAALLEAMEWYRGRVKGHASYTFRSQTSYEMELKEDGGDRARAAIAKARKP